MAADINSVVLVGNLTKEPELKSTPSGFQILNLSIANNYSTKKGDKWENEVNYFDVVVLGKRGEALSKFLSKGKKIAVQGNLRQERWEKEGKKNSRVVVLADSVELLSSSEKSDNSGSNSSISTSKGTEYSPDSGFPEDVPF